LILSAGLRLHRDSLAGVEICPRCGVVWQAKEKFILRGTVSQGFRAPQLNELFMFPPANPDLKPEKVWNYELGGEVDLGNNTWVSLSIFRLKGSNLIEVGPNPSPPPAFLFQNKGEFVFSGAELSWQRQFNRFLFARVDYSFLDPGRLTRGRPRHKLDFLMGYLRGRIKAFVNGQYVAGYYAGDNRSQSLPSYFCLNTRFFWEISQHLAVVVDGQNILDADYQIFVDLPGIGTGPYPMPGRNFQFGLRIRQ
jgi:iron complex outermembrane receptor protein